MSKVKDEDKHELHILKKRKKDIEFSLGVERKNPGGLGIPDIVKQFKRELEKVEKRIAEIERSA